MGSSPLPPVNPTSPPERRQARRRQESVASNSELGAMLDRHSAGEGFAAGEQARRAARGSSSGTGGPGK